MSPVQVVLGIVTVLLSVVAVALVARTVARMVRIIRLGQADGTRTGPFGPRFRTMLVETLGHTRMLKWSHVGVFHWLVMVGFGGLFLALVEAFGEVWNPRFHLPLIGLWGPYSLLVELLGLGTVVGIVVLPRHADRSFCCGAGGARMWMEEKIGRRINLQRVDEALGTGADKIATGCPFCRVMLSDGLTQRHAEEKGTGVEILDVAQLLLAAVTRGDPTPLSGTRVNGPGPTSAVTGDGEPPDQPPT